MFAGAGRGRGPTLGTGLLIWHASKPQCRSACCTCSHAKLVRDPNPASLATNISAMWEELVLSLHCMCWVKPTMWMID